MTDARTQHVRPRPADLLRRIWRGELPLPEMFWNWAVAGGLIVNMITSGLFLVLMLNDQIVAAVLGGYLLSLPYNFIVTVGVWRSADKYEGSRNIAELAKLVTIIGMLALSFT